MLSSNDGHRQADVNIEHWRKKNIGEANWMLEDVPLDESNQEKFTRIGTSVEEKTEHELVGFQLILMWLLIV